MRTSKLLAILASAALLSAPALSFADTYQVYTLESDQSRFFGGMDDAGHVVIYNTAPYNTLYDTFLDGTWASRSTTAPTITVDNGASCTPTVPTGGSVEHGVCNNGRDAFTGFLAAGQHTPNVYVGSAYQDIFTTGGEGSLFMNALGDIVFDDHFSQQWFEAIDLTVPTADFLPAPVTPAPEPSTLLLIATGMLAPIIFLRRRIARAAL